jgi:hypothetical protein
MAYKWVKQAAGCIIHRSEEKYGKVWKSKKTKEKQEKVGVNRGKVLSF